MECESVWSSDFVLDTSITTTAWSLSLDAELDCFLIFCLSRSTMSFLDQPMSASPGYRFGTFVRIIPLSPLSHFSLAADLSYVRPREIMIKNMIDLDGVPAKRTVRDSRCQGRS
ncbi:uncharacterized protein B0T23DRAFT_377835 [Neurospora hispaniola]|uniref:Uncharacterized protein n=1 Tax=Neurospora hispaniola TaxID=588809 RepID=A0AAJ0IAV2_9PEZI|nr:hypothetical protein B0T23DRAFT_377835 [Neurospora hispaniola]